MRNLLLLAVLPTMGLARADDGACLDQLPSATFYFLAGHAERQATLLPVEGQITGFVEFNLFQNRLGLSHRFGGLGLPFELRHVRVTALDVGETGREGEQQDWPAPDTCGMASFFPGQSTEIFETLTRNPAQRLRVEVWYESFKRGAGADSRAE